MRVAVSRVGPAASRRRLHYHETVPRLGFVGFGEAAYNITKGLRAAGWPAIAAWDIHHQTPGRGEKIRARAAETGTRLMASNRDLAENCDWIFSAVTADQALTAAQQTAPGLRAGQIYVDLNSVSPGRKQEIDAVVRAAGADFVEITMMAPVPPYLQKVPILAGGVKAKEVESVMAPFGMKMELVGDKIGVAAATKMCRSVMVKGIEALLTECVLAATYYGAAEKVLDSLGDTFPGPDWNKQASYCIGRVVVHGERRAREMEEVAATLREAGVDPIMAEATVRRMDWSAELGLKELFHGEDPVDYQAFAEAVRSRMLQTTPNR